MKFRTVFKNMIWSGCNSYSEQLKNKKGRLSEGEMKLMEEAIRKNEETIKHLKSVLKTNEEIKVNPENRLLPNIYGVDGTLKEYVDKQNRIHRDWKHRFFYPVFYIGKKILGKYISKEIL